MIWSFSSSRTFKRCQRQWYYKNHLASAVAKDPLRRKAYLLSKLQSVYAWRGSIVDLVISETVIPALKAKRYVTPAEVQRRARAIFDQQLAFARAHRLYEPGLSRSKLGSSFAALYCMEYRGTIAEDDVSTAWGEIELALAHLFEMQSLWSQLISATQLLTQRSLTFSHSGVSVRAVPDVIAFYPDQSPLILDWKVHAFGTDDTWLQLAVYAIALMRCAPHRDFPESLQYWHERAIQLVEVQLLPNKVRRYTLSEEDFGSVEAYIAESATQMLLATSGRKPAELKAPDFPVTQSPDVCQRCPFRSLCWEAIDDWSRNQYFPHHQSCGPQLELPTLSHSRAPQRPG